MKKELRVYQIDTFTKKILRGNPAGVVANANGLTEEQMQDIARELNNPETAFILSPDGEDHDVRIRYFTPTTEVPICGHATISAHFVRAIEGDPGNIVVRQKTKVGIQEIAYEKVGEDYRIVMTQEPPVFEKILEAENKNNLLDALGLEKNDVRDDCPMQIVSTGHSKVMIGIKSRNKLNSLKPNFAELVSLSERIECNGYFVFTLDSNELDILSHGRMFAPAIGINEDPVTGNANGPLGAYLVAHRLVDHDGIEFNFKGKQGSIINREGIVDVSVQIRDGQPIGVKIAGNAVIVYKTQIHL